MKERGFSEGLRGRRPWGLEGWTSGGGRDSVDGRKEDNQTGHGREPTRTQSAQSREGIGY